MLHLLMIMNFKLMSGQGDNLRHHQSLIGIIATTLPGYTTSTFLILIISMQRSSGDFRAS